VDRVSSFGDNAERLGAVVGLDRAGEAHPLDGRQREPTSARGALSAATSCWMRASGDVPVYRPVLVLGHWVGTDGIEE